MCYLGLTPLSVTGGPATFHTTARRPRLATREKRKVYRSGHALTKCDDRVTLSNGSGLLGTRRYTTTRLTAIYDSPSDHADLQR